MRETRLSECISSKRDIECLCGKVTSMLNQSSQASKGVVQGTAITG